MMLFDDLDLFDEGKKRFTQFELLDAELQLWEQFFTRDESDDYFRVLRDATPWQQRTRKMYDKWVLDPRLTAYYGGPNGLGWTPGKRCRIFMSTIFRRRRSLSGRALI